LVIPAYFILLMHIVTIPKLYRQLSLVLKRLSFRMGLCASTEDAIVLDNKKIDQLSAQYSSKKDYVFKSCSVDWIVVLQKLPDTKTNESRSDIKDPNYAKFRADKLHVVDIVHKITNQITNEIANTAHKEKTIIYKKGEIIEVDDFNKDLDEVCAPGIHYVKSVEAAFYYEIPDNYNGLCKSWYNNGLLYDKGIFKNGMENGLWKTWHKNGQLKIKCIYKNGKVDGVCREWYVSGQLKCEWEYKDGELNFT
jgi:antitoxin component YwqK of YwqJK toxin-antitoxin module